MKAINNVIKASIELNITELQATLKKVKTGEHYFVDSLNRPLHCEGSVSMGTSKIFFAGVARATKHANDWSLKLAECESVPCVDWLNDQLVKAKQALQSIGE
jgi:hypothetical protein